MNQIRLGAILSYISIFLTFIVGLIYTPILIRWLGQSDYGLYSLVLSVAAYLSLLDMGLGDAIVRYVARNRRTGDFKSESNLVGQFLKFYGFISLLTVVVGFLIYNKVPNIFQNGLTPSEITTAQKMIIILIINFALSFPLNVYSSVMQAHERFLFLKTNNIIRIILVPILSLIALWLGGGLITMVIITTIVNLSLLFAAFVYCKINLKLKVSFVPLEKKLKKEIYVYSSLILLTGIADKIYWQTDQILLGILKDSDTVAVYAVAMQFITIFISLSIAISSLYLPKISMLVSEEKHLDRLNLLFVNVGRYQFIIMALAFSGFILFGKEFIALWVGAPYKEAYFIVIIIMIPFFFELIQNIGLIILKAKGLYAFRTISLLVFSLLNILISIPIINIYGSKGTAIVTAISLAIGNVIILNIYYRIKIKLDLWLYWKNMIEMIYPVIFLVFIIYILKVKLLNLNNYFLLAITIIVYCFVYLFVLWLFCLNSEEKNKIFVIIDKFRRLFRRQ